MLIQNVHLWFLDNQKKVVRIFNYCFIYEDKIKSTFFRNTKNHFVVDLQRFTCWLAETPNLYGSTYSFFQ